MLDRNRLELLDVAKELLDDLIPEVADELFGLEADVFFPITNRSIYGSKDNRYTYSATPDLSQKFLFIGEFFVERYKSDLTGDPYGHEVYMLTELAVNVPNYSKVIVKLEDDRVFLFRTKAVKGLPGKNNRVYNRYVLMPMEARA